MKWLLACAFGLIGLCALCVFLVTNLSVQKLVPFEQLQLQFDNTHDARVGGGSLRLRSLQAPGLGVMALAWKLCPGLQPLTWCVQVEASDLRAKGRVSLVGKDRLLVRDAHLDLRSLEPFGVASNTVSAQLEADIDRLQLGSFSCPYSPLEVQGTGRVTSLEVLRGAFGDLDLHARSTDNGQQALVLDGPLLEGDIQLDSAGGYSASGELTAPPELEGIIRNFARQLQGNRYAWQFEGAMPC